MLKCEPMPELKYHREPCHFCGAVNELEAETKCRPTSDETGERYCGADFDKEGFAVAPTQDSLAAQNAWIDIHYDCFEGCVAVPRT
jgi:hypothetical protein